VGYCLQNDGMPTALVTGASSGIGEALARQLAARGHDLIIVARDKERLATLAAELAPRDVEILAADLVDPAQLATVEQRASDKTRPIDVLVNNAGVGSTGRFWELDLAKEDDELALNVRAVLRLTHAALPGMVERNRGAIINVSSISGFQPTPGTATYGATKAFVTSFSEAIHEELRGTNVTVSCLVPGATHTEWQAKASYRVERIPSFAWQSADQVATAALQGIDRGRALVVSGWPNKVIGAAVHLAPRALVRRISRAVSGQV
jgi:short-subunit dehydrogenase